MRVVGAGVEVSPVEIVGMEGGLGFCEVIESRDQMEMRRWERDEKRGGFGASLSKKTSATFRQFRAYPHVDYNDFDEQSYIGGGMQRMR
jgi:hypothetical protein